MWNTLATTDVTEQMTSGEVAALENITSDQLQPILAKALNAARSQIKAGGNQVDQTGVTVPDSLAQTLIDIVRWKWLASFPALRAFKTEEREKAHDTGVKRLAAIASSDPKRERTELPATADTTPLPVDGVQVASNQRRKATAHKLGGLI
jgi:hypothetical protein